MTDNWVRDRGSFAIISLPWRVGRSQGRTIYAQPHDDPTKSDHLIGMMDTRELAAHVVEVHNRSLEATGT